MASDELKSKTSVWYLSKYLSEPSASDPGSRGYCLMAELERLGMSVTVLTSDSGHHFFGGQGKDRRRYRTTSVQDQMRVIRIRTLKYRKQRSFRRLLSWLDFEFRLLAMPKSDLPRPDVIIASSLSLLTIVSGLLLRIRYRCRLVFEVRDIWPLTLVEEGGFSRWNPLISLLAGIEWLGYRFSNAVVGTMPNLGEHVRSVVAVAPPVYCVPIGFDERSIKGPSQIDSVRSLANISKETFVVGYAGSMGVSNALETILRCAEDLADDHRLHFVLMGEGDLRSDFQSRFGRLPNVTFHEAVTRGEVSAVLRGCDLLYFATQASSVWKFGQSLNKLVDYMLAGKPIVGSFTGHLTMINEAQCGTVVPADDVGSLRVELLRFAGLGVHQRAMLGDRARAWVLANRGYRLLASEYRAILDGLREPVGRL